MRVINGFVTKSAYVDNQVGVISPFLEISPSGLTYSRKRAEYQHSDHPGNILHVFVARDPAGNEYILPNTQIDLVFDIVNSVMGYTGSMIGEILRHHFTNFMLAGHQDKISSFDYGQIIVDNHRLPDWISWIQQDVDQTEVRIWLNTSAFENQYSSHEIYIVPPLDNLDDFFKNYATTAQALSSLTYSTITDRIYDRTEGYPATCTRLMTFRYYNRANVQQYTDTHWGFIIHGRAGDNIDSMKDALIEYLLENSSYTEADWRVILPEVFKRTEFTIYPRWDKFSVNNSNPLASLYSSIYRPNEMIQYVARNNISGYPLNFVSARLEVIPFDYKAITCAFLPGETNDENKDEIYDIYPDYLPLSTSNLDFNRMAIQTREWVIRMVEAIKVSETASEFSTVLNPFRKVKRNGKVFISFVNANVNYLVSVRSNGLV